MNHIYMLVILFGALALVACNGTEDTLSTGSDITSTSSDHTTDENNNATTTQIGLNPDYFFDSALSEPIETTACTLTDGTETLCYEIVISGVPSNNEIGPFCPTHIDDDATQGGVWFDGSGELYQLDGAFIVYTKTLYGDDWQLYDETTGEVFVTDTQIACEAAARPNVDPEYQNHCVECAIEYYGGGVAQKFLIPASPIPLSNPEQVGADLGVALNGVVIAGPAPVSAILAANTIAAFDDCGGHINPAEGYHYHAALGCSNIITTLDGHANLLGYALDGYGIYAMLNSEGEEDYDLDECRGHNDDSRGYHYHAASAAENMFIGCYQGAQGSVEIVQ